MGLAVVLSTVCALFALAAFGCAYFAWTFAMRAEHSAQRLTQSRGTISALQGSTEALYAQVRSLQGRMSALKRWGTEDEPRRPAPEIIDGEPSCPNWRTQRFPEGDDCAFCEAQRAERAKLRATIPAVGARR